MGCEVEASDLNPVAVLILKCTLEYPQKYGHPDSRPVPDYIHQAASDPTQARFTDGDMVEAYRKNPLATDVRYWGHWMLEKAREELAEFYPLDPDGSIPVAYLWSRTIPCPSCHAEMPLIRKYWLARKDKKKVALEPVLDRENNRVDFKVVEGPNVTGNPTEATTSGGDTKCLLCGQVVKAANVRQAGIAGLMSSTLTCVVRAGASTSGKTYREDHPEDLSIFSRAKDRLLSLATEHIGDLPLVPNEPIGPRTLGLRVDGFGIDQWGKVFNDRQLLAHDTFARLVGDAHSQMLRSDTDPDYAKAVATYLGLVMDRLTDYNSTLTRWVSHGEFLGNTFSRQALPMVWDFAEVNPFSGATGDFRGALDWVAAVMDHCSSAEINLRCAASVTKSGATAVQPAVPSAEAIVTDPPYYDAIDYAGLSDFFYVWLKRSIGRLEQETLSMPLTPKSQQAIMATEGDDPKERERYVVKMGQTFEGMSGALTASGLVGVVFAHANPDA